MRILRQFHHLRAACHRQAQNLNWGIRGIEPARQAPDALKSRVGSKTALNFPRQVPRGDRCGFTTAQTFESLTSAKVFQNLFRRTRWRKLSGFNLQAQTVDFIFNFLSVQNV